MGKVHGSWGNGSGGAGNEGAGGAGNGGVGNEGAGNGGAGNGGAGGFGDGGAGFAGVAGVDGLLEAPPRELCAGGCSGSGGALVSGSSAGVVVIGSVPPWPSGAGIQRPGGASGAASLRHGANRPPLTPMSSNATPAEPTSPRVIHATRRARAVRATSDRPRAEARSSAMGRVGLTAGASNSGICSMGAVLGLRGSVS